MGEITLRPVQREDLGWLATQRNHPQIRQWCRQERLLSMQDQENWFESLLDGDKECFIICSPESVGYVGLYHIDQVHRSAEFSIFIALGQEANGYGKYALLQLLEHAFGDLGLHVVWGEVFEGNPALDMFCDLGFSVDGKLRDRYYKQGRIVNAIAISITRADYDNRYGWGNGQ